MIELISEAEIKSYEYLKIRCEFREIWDRLFVNSEQIDKAVFGRFGKLWPFGPLLTQYRLGNLWFLPKMHGRPLTSKEILLTAHLPMARAWEYPWAILNSKVSSNDRVLDVGSGCSLFPLYLAQKSQNVDSVDTDEKQVTVSAILARILGLGVNYFVDDALSLSAGDDTYDCVFCISVLEHLEQQLENGVWVNRHRNGLDRVAIREFLRVVKPGGRVILTLDYGSKRISPVSFEFDYVTDLVEAFRPHLLRPCATLEHIRFTRERADEIQRLWGEFYPSPSTPFGGALGIALSK